MASGSGEEERVLTITWKIENIGLAELMNLWIGVTSPKFRARTLEAKMFNLSLKPNPEEGTDKQLILNFHLSDDHDPVSFPIDCEWSFIGSKGSPLVSGIMRKHVMVKNEPFKMSGCPTREELFVTRKWDFLPNDSLTVRLRIWSSEGDLSKMEMVSCRTKFEPIEHTFLWPIEEFSALKKNKEIITPIKFGDGGKDNFLLKLTLTGRSLEDSSASLELTPVSVGSNMSVVLNMYVLSSELKKLRKVINDSKKAFPKNSRDTWSLPQSIASNELEKSKCLENDVLNLLCEIRTAWYTEVTDKYNYGVSSSEADN